MDYKTFLKWLIFLFLFFLGLFCYMKDYGYCADCRIPHTQEYLFERYEAKSSWVKPKINKDYEIEMIVWQEEYEFHMFHAKRTFEDAKNRIWWLPDLTWRQIGRDAWISACAMATTKSPGPALVVAVSTMLSSYGLHCLDEWDYIQEKLAWSKYHFEQCDIYAAKMNGN
jgi:hypothetical protein